MRRTWFAVLASVLWLACGGDDPVNPGTGGADASAGRAGASGAGGGARDGSLDRTGTTGGGADVGAGGSGGARDASEASTQDGAQVDVAMDAASGDGRVDAEGGGGNDAGPDRSDTATQEAATDAGVDVSIGNDAGADATAEDSPGGDEPECRGSNDCPTPANECLTATCVDGGCGTTPVALGTAVAVQVSGDCKRKVCNGSGGTQDQNDDADVYDDLKACTRDGCNAGSPTHTPRTGETCGTNGVCSAAGECVGCNVPADCPGDDDFCKTRKCDNGTCDFTYTNPGTALPAAQQTDGDCKTKVCNGSGGTRDDAAPADIVADTNLCTRDVCNGTTPTHPPEDPGFGCGGGHKCDGAGACVECLAPSDCANPAGYPCVVATCGNSHQCGTANAPPDTLCGQGPSCTGGVAHPQDKCNASGTCVPGVDVTCAPFVCGANACNTSCADDNGCSAGNVCDTGIADCIPTGNPKCTDYCATIQANCTGINGQYPSANECLRSCAGLPRSAAMSGNALGCRLTHAGFASGAGATTHCPHAGPAGDGVCGGNCESFCSLAATACPAVYQQFAPDCMTACAGFTMTPARYTTETVTGNTFPCRMYHLTLAAVDPVGHCPHIAVVSATCF